MKRELIAALVFVVSVLLGGYSLADVSPDTNETFGAQIEDIARSYQPYHMSIGEITRVLTFEAAFNKLAANGDRVVDQSPAYLAEPGHTPLQRRIAILAIHKASVSAWARFSNAVLDMYDNHQADKWEVEDTIFPRRFYSTYAEQYFWRPDVSRVLWRTCRTKDLPYEIRHIALVDFIGRQKLLDWLFGSGPY